MSRLKTNFSLSRSHFLYISLNPKFIFSIRVWKKSGFSRKTSYSTQYLAPWEKSVHSINDKYISDLPLWWTIIHVLELIQIPSALSTKTCTNHLWQQADRPISVSGPWQEPALATANTRKTRERFARKWRWRTGKVDLVQSALKDSRGPAVRKHAGVEGNT